jgi:hypothetical protein
VSSWALEETGSAETFETLENGYDAVSVPSPSREALDEAACKQQFVERLHEEICRTDVGLYQPVLELSFGSVGAHVSEQGGAPGG